MKTEAGLGGAQASGLGDSSKGHGEDAQVPSKDSAGSFPKSCCSDLRPTIWPLGMGQKALGYC